MRYWTKTALSGVTFSAVLGLAACKPNTGSGVQDSAPGGTTTSNTGAPGDETGASVGSADAQINSSDYFKPNGTPFTWTDDMTQSALGLLGNACPDASGATTAGSGSGMVAFTLEGSCQMFSQADAATQIANLGAMYAQQGTNLVDILANEATSQQLQTTVAAVPAVDLGSMVTQQTANSAVSSTGTQQSSLLLDDAPPSDAWKGGSRSYAVGSSQFGATTTGYFYTLNKNGVGLRASADVTGRAFSVQRSIVYAKLQAQALTLGQQGEVDLDVQVFGQDAYKQSYNEPQITDSRNLLSLDHNFPGTLAFSIGPIPFSVTWSFHVTGGVPVTYTLRPSSVSGGLNPTATATVGLEGGPDIKVAKAGVDGQFSIVDAAFKSDATVALSTNSAGAPAVCYNATLDFSLTNILGGTLSAYAQVGRPDSKILGVPLGWRGDMKFVDWTGLKYDLPLVSANDQCVAAISG